MAKFEVTISEMESTANKITKASDDFLAVANKVFASAQALSKTWAGDSQTAFAEEQTRAFEWYKRMMELVGVYVENLHSAVKLYQEADEESAKQIRAR